MTDVARARVLVTNIPFANLGSEPLDILRAAGAEVVVNPLGRPLIEDEYAEMIRGCDALLAGVEPVSAAVMDAAPGLRLIARIGMGIDNVDLTAARARGIPVTHTPDAPSPATAELTIAAMLDIARGVSRADRAIRAGGWKRLVGVRLAESTVGVVGVGRIGKRVIRHLVGGFPGVRILAHDSAPDEAFGRACGVEWTDLDSLLGRSDFVTLHVPRTAMTINLIAARELALMKPGARLLSLARGGIVNETDLAAALRAGRLAGAALDVFEAEPYRGELAEFENVVLTCHMGANTPDCRLAMECGAAGEVARLLAGEPFANPVAEIEYARAEGARI